MKKVYVKLCPRMVCWRVIGAQKFVSFSNIPAVLDTVMNIFETVCDCITV